MTAPRPVSAGSALSAQDAARVNILELELRRIEKVRSIETTFGCLQVLNLKVLTEDGVNSSRKLLLKLHEDKLRDECFEPQRQRAKAAFLRVTEARDKLLEILKKK